MSLCPELDSLPPAAALAEELAKKVPLLRDRIHSRVLERGSYHPQPITDIQRLIAGRIHHTERTLPNQGILFAGGEEGLLTVTVNGWEIAAATHAGMQIPSFEGKILNGDGLYVCETFDGVWIICADGIGSDPAPTFASYLALEACWLFARSITRSEIVLNLVQQILGSPAVHAVLTPEEKMSGTTLLAVHLPDPSSYLTPNFAHRGDSLIFKGHTVTRSYDLLNTPHLTPQGLLSSHVYPDGDLGAPLEGVDFTIGDDEIVGIGSDGIKGLIEKVIQLKAGPDRPPLDLVKILLRTGGFLREETMFKRQTPARQRAIKDDRTVVMARRAKVSKPA